MSKLWPRVSKEVPCKICGGTDWLCRFGERAQICMRVESAKPAKDGGFYHFYDEAKPKPTYIPRSRPAPPPLRNAEDMMRAWLLKMKLENYEALAQSLGVCPSSVMALDAAWAAEYSAWSFPMRDGDGNVIGIQLRGETKKAVTGSRLGLFLPNIDPQKICMVCEGASDCAALLTLGFYAIGRPSCCTGADHLKVALRRLGVRQIVIVADNDEPKESGQRPGIDGALKLQKDLRMKSVIWMPSGRCKDVRQMVQKVGIESARTTLRNIGPC